MTDPAHPLLTAWNIPIHASDPYGLEPATVATASLPQELSTAFDGARESIPSLRLAPDGTPPPLPPALRDAILAMAEEHAEEDLPIPLLSRRTLFWRDGDRGSWERQLGQLSVRANEAVLAAVATGDLRWIDRAADALLLLCEQSTWCWVAHEQAHRRRGWVVADPDDPILDLGAGEILQVLAWADFALAPALDEHAPGLRERIRREARIRTFEPYLRRRDWFWLHGRAANWTGWVHQNLVSGALLLLDSEEDRPMRDAVLSLSLAHLDRYLEAFPADGGIDEGHSYFWVGACRLLEAVDLLVDASGGVLTADSVAQVPVIGELLRFPHRMEWGNGWYVNHADAPARPREYDAWQVLHRWGRRLRDEEAIAGALAHRGDGETPTVVSQVGLHRLLAGLGDAEWIAARPVPTPLPRETWLPEVEVLVAREEGGATDGLALAAKGGHNGEAHNHLDVGSVMVALDASPVLIDVGQPTYEAKTFSVHRYEIWAMQSSWHTLPAVRGFEQGVGEEFRARVEGVELAGPGGRGDTVLSVDLTRTYPSEAGLTRLHRRTSLRRAGSAAAGAEVVIENSWELGEVVVEEADPTKGSVPGAAATAEGSARTAGPAGPAPGPAATDGIDAITFHHVLAGEILEQSDGSLRVKALSGATAEILWDAASATAALESREVADERLEYSWGDVVHRLVLTPTTQDAAGSLEVRVRRAR